MFSWGFELLITDGLFRINLKELIGGSLNFSSTVFDLTKSWQRFATYKTSSNQKKRGGRISAKHQVLIYHYISSKNTSCKFMFTTRGQMQSEEIYKLKFLSCNIVNIRDSSVAGKPGIQSSQRSQTHVAHRRDVRRMIRHHWRKKKAAGAEVAIRPSSKRCRMCGDSRPWYRRIRNVNGQTSTWLQRFIILF